MSDEQSKVVDLTGREYKGFVTVVLGPGVGIRVNGEHLEGGPHKLPVAMASQLIHSGSARAYVPPPAPIEQIVEERGEGDEGGEVPFDIQDTPVATQVTHRDPTHTRRR